MEWIQLKWANHAAPYTRTQRFPPMQIKPASHFKQPFCLTPKSNILTFLPRTRIFTLSSPHRSHVVKPNSERAHKKCLGDTLGGRQFVSQETKSDIYCTSLWESKLGVIHTHTPYNMRSLARNVNTTLARSRVGCRASPGLIFTLGACQNSRALGARAASRLPFPTYQYSNNMYAHTHKRRIYTQQFATAVLEII